MPTNPKDVVANARTEHFRDFSNSLLSKRDLHDRFCSRPFEHFEIMHGHGREQDQNFGDVYLCCAGWLSKKVGNYLEQELANIWNSRDAREIRTSILDGSFRYCNQRACPFIQDDRLPRRDTVSGRHRDIVEENRTYLEDLPLSYLLCYDRSCNLSCPSCRTNKILFSEGLGLELPRRLNKKIMKDLFGEPHGREIFLQVTGSGDPFASLPFRELLASLEGRHFPNLHVDLFTNGVMFSPKNWAKLQGVHGHVNEVVVSIDAASGPTYLRVRGGNWSALLQNLDFIGGLLNAGEICHFRTNFVVQAANFMEIGDFVRFCRRFGVRSIMFSLVSDWGTWSRQDFEEQAIWRPSHPRFDQFLEILRDDDLLDPTVRLGPLATYRSFAERM
jgi:hypothetical protein